MTPPPSDFPPGVDPRTPSASAGPETGADAAPGLGVRPVVAAGASASPPWLIGGGAALLGLLAFLWLGNHRPHASQDLPSALPASGDATISAPPPPPEVDAAQAAARGAAPPPPALALVSPPPPTPVIAPSPIPAPAQPPPPVRAPVLVVDLAAPAEVAGSTPAATGSAKAGDATSRTASGGGMNSDEQFAARIETGQEPEHARATMLRDQSTVAPQGTIIPAVLETALNSDLPGFARAVVSRDVRSFDGTQVLIPRGSRVIGEYRSAVALGQSRIFVIWTRVLRPDGGSIQISSGGGDDLGRAGLAGKVDNHFFQRFSGAALLTVLNAAAYAAAGTPSTQVVIGSSGGGSSIGGAAGALAPADIPPTIKVAQGSPIRIFVQRDLDFTPIGGAP